MTCECECRREHLTIGIGQRETPGLPALNFRGTLLDVATYLTDHLSFQAVLSALQ